MQTLEWDNTYDGGQEDQNSSLDNARSLVAQVVIG